MDTHILSGHRNANAIHITAACEGLQSFEEDFKLGAAFMIEILFGMDRY